MRGLRGLLIAGAAVLAATNASAAEYSKSERGQRSGYSHSVMTEGGKVVWLAGATATELPADLDSQFKQIFEIISGQLAKAGGDLTDITTMTVFITDARLGPRFIELRKALFKDNFPASALITVSGLARPEMLIEVQAIAVIGER
jgi:enamine deaminase RidA (YjgF/YER057c/UK114 family)